MMVAGGLVLAGGAVLGVYGLTQLPANCALATHQCSAPPGDPAYADIASTRLLERVMEMLRAAGWRVVNVDTTILAQAPKLAPHLPAMRRVLAPLLGVSDDCVGIKATTAESLGYVGRGEGIEVHAVCLLTRD